MTLFLLIFACSAGILLVLWYIYRTAFYNPPSMRGTIDDPMKGDQYEAVAEHIYRISHIMEKASCEEIQITSFDGCKLFGRYYHLRDGAPLEILFHGYRSCSFRDCSGGHLLSRKMGFNALVIDQRAHGKSSGNTITFGVKEHRDCKMWIDYAVRRFGTDCPIMLSGISMGAATVLMAAGLELPFNRKQEFIDILNPFERLQAVIALMQKEREILDIKREIENKTKQLFESLSVPPKP